MVFENIVVAYDGSEQSLQAVKKAGELAEFYPDTQLHVVYVTTHPNAQLPANFNANSTDTRQYLLSKEDILDLFNKTIADETKKVQQGIEGYLVGIDSQVTIEVIPGYTPAADLLAFAKKINADLIVMGSRGLGAIRGVLGSVSYAVLRESSIPVLVVK